MTIADPVHTSDSFLLVSGFYTGSMMMRLVSSTDPQQRSLWKEERSNRILENGVEVSRGIPDLHSNITTPLDRRRPISTASAATGRCGACSPRPASGCGRPRG